MRRGVAVPLGAAVKGDILRQGQGVPGRGGGGGLELGGAVASKSPSFWVSLGVSSLLRTRTLG